MRHAPARRKAYSVANALADAEIASEIYSTAGDFDLLVKFYVEHGTDIGHFVNEKVQTIPGILADHSGHSGHQDNHHVQGVLGRLAVIEPLLRSAPLNPFHDGPKSGGPDVT